MADEPQYLSTDPNAGQPPKGYLSTDPNAGSVPTKGGVISDWAPTIGGMTGGVLGGLVAGPPGAIGGAALGGAAGEAYKLRQEPVTPGLEGVEERAKRMAIQGAGQGLAQATGEGLALAAGPMARWMMGRALNPAARLANEFPGMADTAIDNAIAISKGGMEKARSLLAAAKATANGILARAEAAGAQVSMQSATGALPTVLNRIMAESSDVPGDLATLARVEREVQAARPAMLTPTQADALKTGLQREARASRAFAAQNPNGPRALMVEAEAKKAMAAGLNDAIDTAAEQAGFDGYREANAGAQQLIGVTRALQPALRTGPNVVRLMVRPGIGAITGGAIGYETGHPGLGALAGAAAISPANLSRLAILLSSGPVRSLMAQLPKPITQSILEHLTSTGQLPPDATAEPLLAVKP